MVSSLNIKLSGEQIRSVIRAIDLDGGGFVDFPEFEAAVKRHEDVRDVKARRNHTQTIKTLRHGRKRSDLYNIF